MKSMEKMTHMKSMCYPKSWDLCEGCGEWKNVIMAEREFSLFHDLLHLFGLD